MMLSSNNSRNLGKMGESVLATLTAQVGITANKASEDETGWDFLLEFPIEKSPESEISLDILPAPVSCRLQVKATDNSKRPIQVKLSNWLRMVKSAEPCFFLILDFAGENHCNKAFLVHCGFSVIEKILKKCREISNSDKTTVLNKIKPAIPIDGKDLLESVDGAALKNKILQHIGSDLHEYSKRKLEFLKSAGYNKLKDAFQVQFDKPDQFACVYDFLVDFALGREKELAFHKLTVNEVRFGIPSKRPLVDSTEAGKMVLIQKAVDRAVVILSSADGLSSIQIQMPIFFPNLLPRDFPKLRFRLATNYIEILIPFRNDAIPEFKFHLPAEIEKTNLEELSNVAVLIEFGSKLPSNSSISFRIEYENICLSSGNMHFNSVFTETDRHIADAIASTKRIAEYCQINHALETSLAQIGQQEVLIKLIAAAIERCFGYLHIEFCCAKSELSPEKSLLIPLVKEIFLGGFRLVFILAVFGKTSSEDLSDEMVRVVVFPCEGFVFKHYKFNEEAVPEFSMADCRKEVFDHFKESHTVVFLEDK